MPSTNLSFRTPQPLLDKIKIRDLKGVNNPGATAKRDLGRWYDLLSESLEEVSITPEEAVILIHYVATYDGCPSARNVFDAGEVLEDYPIGLAEDFDAAKEALGRKYQDWSYATRYAAWDAAERYEVLARNHTEDNLTFGMALHRAGLHTYDLPPDELAVIERMKAAPAAFLPGVYVRAVEEDR
jgi:hypothetical protein